MIYKIFIYVFIGALFGFFNEIYFAPMWEYKEFIKPFLIPGWAISITCVALLSDLIQKKVNLRKQVFVDIAFFCLTMPVLEFLASRVFKIVEYNYWMHENILTMVLGYFIISIFIFCTIRYFYTSITFKIEEVDNPFLSNCHHQLRRFKRPIENDYNKDGFDYNIKQMKMIILKSDDYEKCIKRLVSVEDKEERYLISCNMLILLKAGIGVHIILSFDNEFLLNDRLVCALPKFWGSYKSWNKPVDEVKKDIMCRCMPLMDEGEIV